MGRFNEPSAAVEVPVVAAANIGRDDDPKGTKDLRGEINFLLVTGVLRVSFSPESSYKDRSPESADAPLDNFHGSVEGRSKVMLLFA